MVSVPCRRNRRTRPQHLRTQRQWRTSHPYTVALSSKILWPMLRLCSFLLLAGMFLYQASSITDEYLAYPTAVDVKMEGQGTLKYPGISFCVTNWVSKEKFCDKFGTACNFSEPNWRDKVLQILLTEPHLSSVAIDPEDFIQFGFLNPTFYFVETYFRKEAVQQSFSKLPKHMCFTIDWRKEQFMKFVHQNPLIFQAKLLFFWVPEDIIVMDPFEMDIGFHDVDTLSAGIKHAIVVEPSGEYIFSLEQKVVNYLPAPYDTKCTDYAEKSTFPHYPTMYTKETAAWNRGEITVRGHVFGGRAIRSVTVHHVAAEPDTHIGRALMRRYRARMLGELCYEECKARVIQTDCNCLLQDYVFRHRMNNTACSRKQTVSCVRRTRRKMIDICTQECGKGCREYIYETKQSFWLAYDPENEGEYYIRLKLLMTSRSVDVMHIIPLIKGTQILGIIGGYLGLWLGLSLYLIVYLGAKWMLLTLRRRLKSALNRASLLCVLDAVRAVAYSTSLAACAYMIHLDYSNYQRFETTVALLQNSMEGTHFPAVTVCNKEAVNLSRICWEHTGKGCATLDTSYFQEAILNNRLHIMKDMIKYSYPIESLVLQCYMKTTADTCQSFDCTKMWYIEYSYYKTGVCYTMDPTHSEAYRTCGEPWKYSVTFRLATELEGVPAKEAIMSALLHQQGQFTGGVSSSAMFRPGKRYALSAQQTNVLSLKMPYETQCTDYEEMTRQFNYTKDVIQQEECSEKCLADQWKNKCDCYPKLYSMKHVLKGNLCEYLAHLKCNDYMKTMNWLPFCQNQCTRPCRNKEIEVTVVLGTTKRRIVQTLPRMLGSDLITYFSGHVSMWLGVSLLQLADILSKVYKQLCSLNDSCRRPFGISTR
ncbi:uncharacterized protein LOC119173303 isoform X3 [Rhipicephalus microplus]|uniref:uncharacterized protein LOC119173303 isoform X3 n=1 Tax=Rhipicephalus microplus TaxID=6941 RepID=UPI003F6BDEA0